MYLQTYIPKFVQNFSNNSAIRKAQRAPYHRIRCQGSEGDLPSMDHPLKASNSGLGSSILTQVKLNLTYIMKIPDLKASSLCFPCSSQVRKSLSIHSLSSLKFLHLLSQFFHSHPPSSLQCLVQPLGSCTGLPWASPNTQAFGRSLQTTHFIFSRIVWNTFSRSHMISQTRIYSGL